MSETIEDRPTSEQEIRELQASIDQSSLRRAADLSIAEKFKLGADLYDDGIRWLKQIIKAEQPDFTAEQVNQELDRRKLDSILIRLPTPVPCTPSSTPYNRSK